MFDLNKIKKAATKLGMEITFNSSNPGMHFQMPDGTVDVFTYDELKKSLHDEFTNHKPKISINYNLKTEGLFSIDIQSQALLVETPSTINRIELSISGHNKISEKNETHFKDIQLTNEYSNSNLGAA